MATRTAPNKHRISITQTLKDLEGRTPTKDIFKINLTGGVTRWDGKGVPRSPRRPKSTKLDKLEHREAEYLNGMRSDFDKQLSTERLPKYVLDEEIKNARRVIPVEKVKVMTDEELTAKIEVLLQDRIRTGDKLALFQLGMFYYEQQRYNEAADLFETAALFGDYQAMFQIGVILYDGLAGVVDYTRATNYMQTVAALKAPKYSHLSSVAQYNMGRAHLQGFGVKQSDKLAEEYWRMAAADGSLDGSVKAQSALGLFYTREDSLNLEEAAFWHSEACGNGNLESQGILGVMYLHGLGKPRDMQASFECLREASRRGNVFAMGHLASFYYKRKMYSNCATTAAKAGQFEDYVKIGHELDVMTSSIAKGISMGCFYYAQCLDSGLGCPPDKKEAKTWLLRSFKFCPDMCDQLTRQLQFNTL